MKKQPFQIAAKRRSGRCYELACAGILRSAAVTLVHGEVRGPSNSRIGHAWLAGDGFVYDPVSDEFFVPADYYARFAAQSIQVFTQYEAAVCMKKTGHYGPWE